MKKISIVIPILNESSYLKRTLDALLELNEIAEIIIADGNSSDGSQFIASKYPFQFLESEKGRANQMNAGANISNTNYLLFLHVDSFIDQGLISSIKDLMQMDIPLASFRLSFHPSTVFLSFNALFSWINHPWFYFGDQALWIKKDLFEKLNGFDENCFLLEDQEFYSRACKIEKPYKSSYSLITSSRAYQKYGALRLQLLYYRIWFQFKLGYSQQALKRIKESFESKYRS